MAARQVVVRLDPPDFAALCHLVERIVAGCLRGEGTVPGSVARILLELRERDREFHTNALVTARVESIVAGAADGAGSSVVTGELTTHQAARVLGCTPQWVGQLAHRGHLRGRQLGERGPWRLDRESVVALAVHRSQQREDAA